MMRKDQSRLAETPSSDGRLPAALGWSMANAVLPGLALLKSGRRSGWLFLAAFLAIPVGALAAYFLFDGLALMTKIAVRPGALVTVALCLVVLALGWALLVVVGNHLMNTVFGLEGRKRVASIAVGLTLVAAVGVPAGLAVRALESQRSLLLNSFSTDDAAANDAAGNDSDDTLTADSPEPEEDPWEGQPRLNIMLLGHDSGKGRVGTRPDAIMVASIDTRSGATSLFSIPRNLQYVEFPPESPMRDVFPNGFDAYGPNQNLINAVWTWAADHPEMFPDSSNPGLLATQQAVEYALGLSIDRYAMVNMQGFVDGVNALGGVEIVVERRIPMKGRYIEPGRQVLEGDEALWYARSRQLSDDFDRICRQQRIIRAVTGSIEPAKIASSFTKLAQAAESNLSTNIRVSELDAMIELLFKVRGEGISSHPITPVVTNPGSPDFDALHRWVDAAIEDDGKQPSTETPDSSQDSEPEDDGKQPSTETPDSSQDSEPEDALGGCMP